MAKREVNDADITALVENSVALQRVLADLAGNLKGLSDELSQLVALFKEASKSISEEKTSEEISRQEILGMNDKLERLLDQNKTIAKGIVLVESAMREPEKKKSFL